MARMLPLFLIAVGFVAAACGSSHSSLPTISKTKTYRDPTLHFRFRYPADWKVPGSGKVETIGGAPTYVVHVTIPGNAASAEVTASTTTVPIPSFSNGEVKPDPNGGPDKFHYFHVSISGLKGMRIERYSGKQSDEIDSVANSSNRLYDVRMIAATPPFAPRTLAGYNLIVRSLKVPFS